MTKVASIDCGTNTIKLLIGAMPDVEVREMRYVRLGQDVDRTGVLAAEALDRAFAAIDEYAALIRSHGVERVRFVATSATRDAANAADFVAGVRERLGIEPEVVSGAEEAALAYSGVVRNLRRSPEPPVLVVDVGGGSTELIRGGPTADTPEAAHSMDIGSVRLTERHLRSDPPTAAEVSDCCRDIDAHLDDSPVPPEGSGTVIGVAGTVTQIAAGLLGLTVYDHEALDQAELAVSDVHGLVDRLVSMSVDERRALTWMHPGRADVIGAGGLILSRVLRRTNVDRLVVSDSDILDGIAWSITD